MCAGRYSTECARPRRDSDPAGEEPGQEGAFEIGTSGYMICWYCGQTTRWPRIDFSKVAEWSRPPSACPRKPQA